MLQNRRAYPTIPASDIERAKAWYREKLGLSPASEDPAGVRYALGGGTGFQLYPTGVAGQAPNTLMVFSSEDIDDDVRTLRGRGVVFEDYDFPGLRTVNGIATLGAVHAAWFRDSEGNILAIGDGPN